MDYLIVENWRKNATGKCVPPRDVAYNGGKLFDTESHIYHVCLLPEMTATQVTVDKNILFILLSCSLDMLHIYVTLHNFTSQKVHNNSLPVTITLLNFS